MIQIQNITKRYAKSDTEAVKDLSLEIPSGSIFGFLGPNGAGKTTTIKLMTGLLKADKGEILLDGINIRTNPMEAKRIMGYVPDTPLFYEKMTGIRFLSFIGSVFGLQKNIREIVEPLAAAFELSDSLNSVISGYSHGMRQKLALISAFIHSPKVLILDEPIIGLDPKSSFVLKEKLRECARSGTTVFFSTHLMEVAEKLCDTVGIIHKGKILAVGDPQTLREKTGKEDADLESIFLEVTDDAFSHS